MAQFNTLVHVACGNDELRPIMHYVYFSKGRAVATDAHIMVIQDLKYVHGFDDLEVERIEGKFIHKKIFELLQKQTNFIVREDGIEVFMNYQNVFFKWAVVDGKYPNVDGVIRNQCAQVSQIGINPSFLVRAGKCLFSPGDLREFKFVFSGESTMIIVCKTTEEDHEKNFVGLMPIKLHN